MENGGYRHLPLAAIITDSRAEWNQSAKQSQQGPARDLMANALMPNEVDAALMQVSMDMFGGIASVRVPKPWQTPEVQITLKQVWAGRTELCKMQSNLLSGENVRGIFDLWRQWAQFNRLRKQLRKVSAEKRRQQWDAQLQEAELALDKGDAHAFYSAVKRMAPKVERGRVQLRSKNGDILTAEEEMEALYQHWQKLFDMRSLPEQDWCLVNPIDIGLDEVRSALQSLVARKASVPGTALRVAWKYGGPRIMWGDPSDLRPIALQPAASKVFSALIKVRLKPYLDQIVVHYPQFAHVEGRGTAEAIGRVAQHCSRIRSVVRGQKQDLRSKFAGVKSNLPALFVGAQLPLKMEVIGVPYRVLSIPVETCKCIKLRPDIARKQRPECRGNHTALLDPSRHRNLSLPGSITAITKNVGAGLMPGDHGRAEVGRNARPLQRAEESRSRDAVEGPTKIYA